MLLFQTCFYHSLSLAHPPNDLKTHNAARTKFYLYPYPFPGTGRGI